MLHIVENFAESLKVIDMTWHSLYDRSHTVPYLYFIVTMTVTCTVYEMYATVGL